MPLIDETKSLNDLLGWRPAPPPYPTRLVEKCEAAFAAPLASLTPGQIQLLVGQGFALEILLPKAFSLLVDNPLIATEFYEGDLLCACLRAKKEFWADHDQLWFELATIVQSLQLAMETVDVSIAEFQARSPHGAAP
jgi:hypothetical protein